VEVILLTIYLVKIQTQVNPIITEFDSVRNPLLRITSWKWMVFVLFYSIYYCIRKYEDRDFM